MSMTGEVFVYFEQWCSEYDQLYKYLQEKLVYRFWHKK